MTDVAGKLDELFNDLMPTDIIPVRERTRSNCAKWDSMFELNLITCVEEEFRIQITDDEALELTSFQAAVRLIEEKQRAIVNQE